MIVLSLIVWITATCFFYQSNGPKYVGLKIFLYVLIALMCIGPNVVLAVAGYEFFGAIICIPVGICAIILVTLSVITVMLKASIFMSLHKLPPTYVSFMQSSEPKCGYTDLEMAAYFDLEPLELIGQLNRNIEMARYADGFTAFSCTDGEALVFNEEGKIFSLPLIGMSGVDAIFVCESWDEFVKHIETDA